MAKLRIFKSINNDVYTVSFLNDLTALSQSDKEAMLKHGEPEINVGGVYLESTENEFELPDEYVKIKNDFQPYVKDFDSRSEDFESNTATKVNAFIDGIKTKFNDALETLRAEDDSFTGEEIYEV